MDEEGGYHVFGQNFLSQITGNFFWETFVPYVFPSEVFCLTIPKIFIANSSWFQKISVMGGNEWTRRAASQISVKFDFASFYRKISFGTLRCLREILAAKCFYGCQGGVPRFSVDFFCLTLPLTLFSISSVSQNISGSEEFVWMRDRDIPFFCRKIFESQYRRTSLGIFVVSETFWYGKNYMDKPLGDANFRHFCFCLILSKRFLGISPSIEKVSGSEGFFGCEGDITFLQRIVFVSHYQELSMGTLHFWRKNSCIENFLWLCLWYHLFLRTLVCLTLPKKIEWEQFGVAETLRWRKKTLDERGGYHVFPSKCFCPTLPENFFGNSLVFHNISGSEKFVWMRERDITLFRQKKIWITVPEKFNWKFRGFRNFLV